MAAVLSRERRGVRTIASVLKEGRAREQWNKRKPYPARVRVQSIGNANIDHSTQPPIDSDVLALEYAGNARTPVNLGSESALTARTKEIQFPRQWRNAEDAFIRDIETGLISWSYYSWCHFWCQGELLVVLIVADNLDE